MSQFYILLPMVQCHIASLMTRYDPWAVISALTKCSKDISVIQSKLNIKISPDINWCLTLMAIAIQMDCYFYECRAASFSILQLIDLQKYTFGRETENTLMHLHHTWHWQVHLLLRRGLLLLSTLALNTSSMFKHKHKHTYIDRTCAKDKHSPVNNTVEDL